MPDPLPNQLPDKSLSAKDASPSHDHGAVLQQLAGLVGAKNLLTEAAQQRPYLAELRGRYDSACLAVARPADAAQVAAVLACCNRARLGLVPQGGNTGAVGGAVARGDQIIVNLARLSRIVAVDAANYTMRVQAGCILADIQAAAAGHDRFFPLSLGAEGSCQIGGNLATNAGGVNVLHYGNARDLTLGLEVALADGRIWRGLNSLRKNNTGYDLKNLFIGSEGTLGIITAAVLKLFPAPRRQIVALAGLNCAAAALALLGRLRAASSDRLVTFELMAGIAVRAAIKHIVGQTDPMRQAHRWYVLMVATSTADGVVLGDEADESGDKSAETAADDADLRAQVEACLAQAIADGGVQDVVLASSEDQARRLCALRVNIVEAQKFEGGSIKHDIAVPVASVPEFLRRAHAAVIEALPGARPYPYGHMGDGNMHFNIAAPLGMPRAEFLRHWQPMNRLIHEIADQLGGTFSAEHGVGMAKLDDMQRYKDPVALALQRQIKQALDPRGILNPGKLNP